MRPAGRPILGMRCSATGRERSRSPRSSRGPLPRGAGLVASRGPFAETSKAWTPPLSPPCATMCYMKRRRSTVGVRELRQSLSVYLRRVASGETLQVTDRGRAVALLTPLPVASTAIERLVAVGRATAPRGDLLDLGVPRETRSSRRVSRALQELRAERL